MAGTEDVWFRIGSALERARMALPAATGHDERPRRKGSGGGGGGKRKVKRPDRKGGRAQRRGDDGPPAGTFLLDLLRRDGDGRSSPLAGLAAAGTGTVALRLARKWADRRRPPLSALLAAAAAGAGAGLLRELVLAVAEQQGGGVDEGLVESVLEGAAEGLAYGALLEPWLPESPWAQGVLVGSAGYVAAPWGGVGGLLRPLAPHRALPVVGRFLDTPPKVRDRPFLQHLAFGVALALLYDLLSPRP